MKVLIKISKGCLCGLVGILAAWALFLTVGKLIEPTQYPMLFGYSEAGIMSGSMEPAISQGDHIIFRRQDGYEVGDVVVYYDRFEDIFVAHRIVGTDNGDFILKGDYNPECDSNPVRPEHIQGKVIYTVPNLQSFLLVGYGALLTVTVQLFFRHIKLRKGGKQTNEE